jgi:DNA polymerase-3 subunit gamma/tau
VYLIDEVHMLSGHSFNALLKTLEEPPPHVKFLLATTDPQKLPATVLSRCLQLHLRNLSPEQITDHLERILAAEGLEGERAGLWQIAIAAQGSMRDALSLTDQAIAHGGGRVAAATVSEMLGYVEREQLRALLDALLAADAPRVLGAVESLATQGADCERVLAEVLAELHRIALVQAVPAAIESVHGDREQTQAWASAASQADLQLYYQIGLQCRRDMPYAPDARSGLEMALLRMLAFRPASAPSSASLPTPAAPAREVAGPAKKPDPPETRLPEARRAPDAVSPLPAPQVLQEVSLPETSPELPPDPGPEAVAPAALAALDATNWAALLEILPLAGMARSLAMHALPRETEGARVVLDLSAGHASLASAAATERLAAALAAHFGEGVDISLRAAEPAGETPAGREARLIEERRVSAVLRIEQDPNVRLLLDTFAGRLLRDSIRPVETSACAAERGN